MSLAAALEAAHAAGALLAAARVEGPRSVAHKGAVDLVTEVDLACEEAIREVLSRRTPDIPVLGEEGGGAESATTRWVVDPLDGTTNFVHGFPWYCVSVALEVDGRSEVAVVLDPVRGLVYQAERGRGAWCAGRRMSVSATADLSSALVGTGFPYDRRERAAFYLARVEVVLVASQGIRRCGAAALDLAMVADGRLDAFWEFGLKRWDVAAGSLLVEEAGGRVTGHRGEALEGTELAPLATNGRVHARMMELLAGC